MLRCVRDLRLLLTSCLLTAMGALALAPATQAQLVNGGTTVYVGDRDAGVLAVQTGNGAVSLVTEAIRPEHVVGGAGTLYAIAGGQVYRVDTATGTPTALPGVLAGGDHVDIAPDGNHLIVTRTATIDRVSLATGASETICGPLPLNDQPWVAATAKPDGTVIAWAHDYPGGDVYAKPPGGDCALLPGNPFQTYTEGNGVLGSAGYAGLAATADGRILFSNGGSVGANDGHVWLTGTGQVASLRDPGKIAVAPDGTAYVIERRPAEAESQGEIWAIPPTGSQTRVADDAGGAGLFDFPSSIAVLCRWGGCVQATPSPLPGPAPVDDSDRAAKPTPKLSLPAGRKGRRATLAGRKLKLPRTTCARACRLTVTGKVKVAGRRKALAVPKTTRALRAGRPTGIAIELPRKLARTLAKALGEDSAVTARLRLVARSPGAKPLKRRVALAVRR
jgi:sugar lactone lactonase YvrE